jgi:hypothetical protein
MVELYFHPLICLHGTWTALPCTYIYIYINRINGWGDPLRWPRDTLYPQKFALTSPTSGGRSVGIVRLRTKGHGGYIYCVYTCTLTRSTHFKPEDGGGAYLRRAGSTANIRKVQRPKSRVNICIVACLNIEKYNKRGSTIAVWKTQNWFLMPLQSGPRKCGSLCDEATEVFLCVYKLKAVDT